MSCKIVPTQPKNAGIESESELNRWCWILNRKILKMESIKYKIKENLTLKFINYNSYFIIYTKILVMLLIMITKSQK